MSYLVEYINCKVCGSDRPHFLGFRGNLEYIGASSLSVNKEHMVTNVVKCRNCGFIYANPRIIFSRNEESEFYSDPKQYQSSVNYDPLKIFDVTISLIEKFAMHKGRLLDIGAGKGEFLAVAQRRKWEVFGVEPSYDFVRYAKNKYGLNIENCYLEKINFPEHFFDVVTLNMVLEHIDGPHNLLSVIYRILKPGGLLYIEVPNMDSGLLKIINFYYRLKGNEWSSLLSPLHPPYHNYGYQKTSLKLLCQLNKFKIKRFFIFGIGLRGFRYQSSYNKLERIGRNILAKVMGLIGQGDVLVALATK